MNKSLFLIAAFLLTVQFSIAQTTAGTRSIGLGVSYYSNKSNNLFINPGDNSTMSYVNKMTNFNIGPTYAYFIANNLDVGGSLSYSSYSLTYSGDYTGNPINQEHKNLGGLLFIRKYLLYQNKIGLRTGLYAGYDRETLKSAYPPPQSIYNQNSSANDYNAGLRFDIVYYPLKHFGLAATFANIGYDTYKSDNTTQGKNNGSSINASFTNGLQLSVAYIFE